MHPFRFDRDKAERSIHDPDGALWPVNAYSDADELNGLVDDALTGGVIVRRSSSSFFAIYPMSLSEPDPQVAVNLGPGPALLGHPMKLRDEEGESPVEFTLRLLEELVDEANGLAAAVENHSRTAAQEAEGELTLLCPRCCSEDVAPNKGETSLECSNCGAPFARDEALVSVADAEAHAESPASCACSDVRGCPRCLDRAERLIGALVRDDYGREWRVTETDEKGGFPTVCGQPFWARLEDVEVLHEAA